MSAGNGIAAAVETAMGFGLCLAVFRRVDVGAPPGQKKAVTQIKKVRQRHKARV